MTEEKYCRVAHEAGGAKIHQKIFRFLGEAEAYPFCYWGPHLLLEIEKEK